MRHPRQTLTALLLCLPLHQAIAQDTPDSALGRAQKLSSLTAKDAKPFHIKLTVSEPANPSSPYHATIEETWLSKTRWTRTISTPTLTQTIYVDGDKHIEQNTGDYYPLWVRSFVTAAVDPLENEAFWTQVSARIATINFTQGKPSSSCARAQFKIGTAALNNDAFAVICFNADGTLESVVSPGYSMEFHDPRPFGKKRIAYRLTNYPEPGTTLVATVDILEEPGSPAAITPPNGAPSTIQTVNIKQETFNKLSEGQPEIIWPAVHSGNASGKLSMYVSADRNGRIREAYPLNSDNAGLQDAARNQLLKWQLKPAVSNGERVQTEAAITFGFDTKLDPTAPALTTPNTNGPVRISSGVAQGLLLKSYPPSYPPEAIARHITGRVILRAIISKNGTVSSLAPMSWPDPSLAGAAVAAVKQWVYKPYILNGSPVEVETTITVNFDTR